MARIPTLLAIVLLTLMLIPVVTQNAEGQLIRRGRNRCCPPTHRTRLRLIRHHPTCNTCNHFNSFSTSSFARDVNCCWAPSEGQCVPAIPPAPDCGCSADSSQPVDGNAAPEIAPPASPTEPATPQTPAPAPEGASVPAPGFPFTTPRPHAT